jgi:predicted dehydrogenase
MSKHTAMSVATKTHHPIEVVLIGAGQRGAEVYGAYALRHPEQLRFIAVAEPHDARRARFAAQHNIPPQNQFTSWEALFERPRFAQAALICTQDQLHTAPTLAALRAGYDVLLEKPMATTPEECRLLVDTAEELGRQLHVSHVLRYTPHFQKMRALLRSGVLGEIINVAHRENVSWWHMAHSYVRGNWRNTAQACPMILAKCCHDFDILLWLLERPCERLSSVGSLIHFRPENAPPGAPQHCLDGCPVEKTCPYYAPWIYLDLAPLWRSVAATAQGAPRWIIQMAEQTPGLVKALGILLPPIRLLSDYRGWPRSVVALDPSRENLLTALRSGPYGRCVYHCDNDVVDHQVVMMEFAGGISVTLTMHGHSHLEYRTSRIEGTRATLLAQFGLGGSWIEIHEHRSNRKTRYNTSAPLGGHGGGDEGLMDAFVRSLRYGEREALTIGRQALESHLLAFAAEQARLTHQMIERRAWE